ncbi:U3 small nucleolar RNA-associated protein 4 homolog isoform X2 [Stegodyphus dumicola]|uniref:U3 small nucleolar RNA-associated protein 4 homolog isoform X2 n=1 Tax=Stegodyphus dumicola TaxID=202533 RepID=UPI0015AE66E3|nr:U3 small nucleolar RNA-associated protein 4 homolog isoform X2 [Stegodyphus dumicola]
MKSLRVHRINFFDPQPKAIRCIGYDETSTRLAVSRADSSIEIWDVKKYPYLEKVIPGSSTTSVETLAWCNDRLFSAGLHGYIAEHNLNTLIPKYQLSVTSGCPIWCMSVNEDKTCLAIGNEDGHVVLHDMSPEGLDFVKKFDKQEGCILSLAWHTEGQIIVTGSLDTIRIWNVQTGHVINRIILGRSAKNIATVVWCLAITKDMTIVSGDSCGKTSFWDANTGTQLSSVGGQKNDVLTLCLNEEEDTVYVSGVDPTITMFMKYPSNGKWLKSIQRIVHTHDIRALCLIGEFLVSGGDDCNLVFTKYPPKTTIKFFPFCQMPYAVVSPHSSCVLLRYPSFLELWQIGSSTSGPTNLLQVKAKVNETIICSSISADGKWIAYSSQFQMRLFRLQLGPDTSTAPSVSKVMLPEEIPSVATLMLFSSEHSKLLFYAGNKIYILRCDDINAVLEATVEEDVDSAGQIHLMELSGNGSRLACGSHNGCVIIYCLKNKKIFCKLPMYKYQPTVLKFDPSSENLIVAYSDRKLPFVKKKMKGTDDTEITYGDTTFQTVSKYEHISSIHSFADDLVVVQISSSRILESLPPPVWKKKYGT